MSATAATDYAFWLVDERREKRRAAQKATRLASELVDFGEYAIAHGVMPDDGWWEGWYVSATQAGGWVAVLDRKHDHPGTQTPVITFPAREL
ncbi:MAG TPA: hypothetical protein VG265_11950 [Gaiellaceae bacterium]|nr:hypothetical protein [Gaiellaceae bacterium]